MKKPILMPLAVILVAGLGYAYFESINDLPLEEAPAGLEQTPESEIKEETVPEPEKPKPAPVRTFPSYKDPWALVAKRLEYLEARDQAGFNSLSHNQVTLCAGADDACKESLTNSKNSLKYMLDNKDIYANKWEDQKQLVLLSELIPEDKYHTRKSVFFTKDAAGNLKYLAKYDYTSAEANLIDTDQDGKIDPHEECSLNFKNCVETNPKKKDTDQDGWWDGTELFLK